MLSRRARRPMNFTLRRLTVHFRATAAVQFPPTMAANVLRGTLGSALPRHLFTPVSPPDSPSGLAAPPRPFVLRTRHLDSCRFLPGQQFPVTLHLFGDFAGAILAAFGQAAPFHGQAQLIGSEEEQLSLPLLPAPARSRSEIATVHFVTPTELKVDSGLAQVPEFPILFARALTRLRTLTSLYGNADVPGDSLTLAFEEVSALARTVKLTGHHLTHEWAERRSSRTGQTHPLGGFTGSAAYAGPLHRLLPILRAGAFTGVGRQTVWGKGEIVVEPGNLEPGLPGTVTI